MLRQIKEAYIEQRVENGQQEKRHIVEVQIMPAEQIGGQLESQCPAGEIGDQIDGVIKMRLVVVNGVNEQIVQRQRQQGAEGRQSQHVLQQDMLAIGRQGSHHQCRSGGIVRAFHPHQDERALMRRDDHVLAVVQHVVVLRHITRVIVLHCAVAGVNIGRNPFNQSAVRINHPVVVVCRIMHRRIKPVGAAEQTDFVRGFKLVEPAGQVGG